MTRRLRVLVFALGIAGCGGFLGLSGDDDEDEQPSSPVNVDGSPDGRDDEGGNDIAPPADGGVDVTKKDASLGSNDASPDAKSDASDAANEISAPPPFKYVFVTSVAYAGTFGIGGETAAGGDADILCKTRGDASSVSKVKGRIWRAWVSTATPADNAAQRIGAGGALPFRMPDNTVVANSVADLTDGTLAHAIDRDENGAAVGEQPVWTGSSAAGALINVNCGDWTSVMGGATGKVGTTASTNGAWSEDTDRGCAQLARLYCFEQ